MELELWVSPGLGRRFSTQSWVLLVELYCSVRIRVRVKGTSRLKPLGCGAEFGVIVGVMAIFVLLFPHRVPSSVEQGGSESLKAVLLSFLFLLWMG